MSSVEDGSLLLEITEQPTILHRSRYASETTETTVAGLLNGRLSTDTRRSFVKVKVLGIDPRLHKIVRILACVVDPGGHLHPNYLHGHNCAEGFYQSEKIVDQHTAKDWDIRLDYQGVVCTSKKDMVGALSRRKASQLANYLKKAPDNYYNKLNLRIFCLEFILVWESHGGTSNYKTIRSDEIYDESSYKALRLDSLNPEEISSWGSDLAIYTETATTGILMSDVVVKFLVNCGEEANQGSIIFKASVKDVRAHLITLQTGNISDWLPNERAAATLTIHIGPAVSSPLKVIFDKRIPLTNAVNFVQAIQPRKRKR